MSLVIAAAVFVTVVALVLALYNAATAERQLVQRRLGIYAPAFGVTGLARPVVDVWRRPSYSAFPALDRALGRWGFIERTALELARANVPLRAGEYLIMHAALVIAGFIAGFGLGGSNTGLASGLLLASALWLLPRLTLRARQARRVKRFNALLPEALDLMSSSLRGGHGILQGLEIVIRELPPPISHEFAQLLEEVNLGGSLEAGLRALERRVPSAELSLLVTAILVQTEVGGNLTEVLDRIAATLRERARLRQEVHVITTGPRVSAYVVSALPGITAGLIYLINPYYLTNFLANPAGKLLLVVAAALTLSGLYLSQRVTQFEI